MTKRVSLVLAWLFWCLVACAATPPALDPGESEEGAAGPGGGAASSSTGGPDIDGGQMAALVIEPATAAITVTSKGQPPTQSFKAILFGEEVTATWSLDSYDLGAIDSSGTFQPAGIVGGKIDVVATSGDYVAHAELQVFVDLEETVLSGPYDPGPSAQNQVALDGPPAADTGPNAMRILYPYDQTVMPRGLLAPLVQMNGGVPAPEDLLVELSSDWFAWKGYYHLANPSLPQLTVPQDIWDAALASAQGSKLGISITKAAGGVALGPHTISITVAAGSLRGRVFYQTYEQPTGLYSVRPGDQAPATIVKQGCFVCHSVSANGARLSIGSETGSTPVPDSGVYAVNADGTITQLTGPPDGLDGDSRNLSDAAFTPDGKYVTRSQTDFWGGPNQRAWRIDEVAGKLDPATVVGLEGQVSAYLPAFSPNGARYAFTNGYGEPQPFGSPTRSLSVMDVTVDDSVLPGTLTFSNRKLLLDGGPGGYIPKYVTFLPDSESIVFQMTDPASQVDEFDYMLPTQAGPYLSGGQAGRLHLVDASGQGHVELSALNEGNGALDRDHNYEPFALPVPAGGYYWVVFTSTREYGNTMTVPNVRKQLWVAAISPPGPNQTDPSHPAFFLPNQSMTKNERGFWALDPCKASGDSCQTGDQCCEGFCNPADPSDPQSDKVCGGEPDGCAGISDKCSSDADCCASRTGVHCLGGFCSPDPPK